MTVPMRVLVVGPSWVGDMVMAQSLCKALHQHYPHVLIDVLAPAWSLPLLDHMPEVHASFCLPFEHGQLALRERWKLGRTLRKRYDRAIVLPNSWKSAIVPFSAAIPRRTGWVGELRYGLLNDLRYLDRQRLPMTVQRFVALATAQPTDQTGSGYQAFCKYAKRLLTPTLFFFSKRGRRPASALLPKKATPQQPTQPYWVNPCAATSAIPPIIPPSLAVCATRAAKVLQHHQLELSPDQRVLVLCPGAAYGPAKRWPEVSYAAVASHWLAQGWAVWLLGSAQDQTVCATINAQTQQACVDFSGHLVLAETIALLSYATAVVSNDSGLMHVAAALNRPVVALYGSTDPQMTPPLHTRQRILYLGLSCSPCFQRDCPLGHLACLQQLSVTQVLAALHELVNEPAPLT